MSSEKPLSGFVSDPDSGILHSLPNPAMISIEPPTLQDFYSETVSRYTYGAKHAIINDDLYIFGGFQDYQSRVNNTTKTKKNLLV